MSQRVPFGTGPTLQRYAALQSTAQVHSYHPESFRLLRSALRALRLRANSAQVSLNEVANHCGADGNALQILWQQFNCEQAIAKAHANSRSPAQCERHLMTWFDAFRTLKWVHACRGFNADIPLFDAIENADWITDSGINQSNLQTTVLALQQQLAKNQLHSP